MRKTKAGEGWARGMCCGKGALREGLSEKVTFQWRPEQRKGGSCAHTWGETFQIEEHKGHEQENAWLATKCQGGHVSRNRE